MPYENSQPMTNYNAMKLLKIYFEYLSTEKKKKFTYHKGAVIASTSRG